MPVTTTSCSTLTLQPCVGRIDVMLSRTSCYYSLLINVCLGSITGLSHAFEGKRYNTKDIVDGIFVPENTKPNPILHALHGPARSVAFPNYICAESNHF